MKIEFSRLIFYNESNNIFYETPSCRSRAAADGETGGRTDMTKLKVTFCKCANAPKNEPTGNGNRCFSHKIMILQNLSLKIMLY